MGQPVSSLPFALLPMRGTGQSMWWRRSVGGISPKSCSLYITTYPLLLCQAKGGKGPPRDIPKHDTIFGWYPLLGKQSLYRILSRPSFLCVIFAFLLLLSGLHGLVHPPVSDI
jgi:hypothetical protein